MFVYTLFAQIQPNSLSAIGAGLLYIKKVTYV